MSEPADDRRERGLWWDKAWTLVEGCTRCSAGCKDCWALALEKRTGRGVEGGGIKLRWDRLDDPLHWRKPRVIAVWNDLFHEEVSGQFIFDAVTKMSIARAHRFIVLTKRARRARELFGYVNYRNVILGVTCESDDYLWRVEELVQTPAACRFVNAHLVGPLDLRRFLTCGCCPPATNPNDINWLAIECNRPFRGDPAVWWGWCESLVAQAKAAGIPRWVKQGPRLTGKGVTHDLADFPESCRVREFANIGGNDDGHSVV